MHPTVILRRAMHPTVILRRAMHPTVILRRAKLPTVILRGAKRSRRISPGTAPPMRFRDYARNDRKGESGMTGKGKAE